MFDISSIMNRFGSIFEAGGAVQETIGQDVQDTLANSEIGQALAEHLPIDRIDELVGASGIDVAALTDGQVAEIVGKFGTGNGLEGLDLGRIVEGGLQK